MRRVHDTILAPSTLNLAFQPGDAPAPTASATTPSRRTCRDVVMSVEDDAVAPFDEAEIAAHPRRIADNFPAA